jgi:hypothetical protein
LSVRRSRFAVLFVSLAASLLAAAAFASIASAETYVVSELADESEPGGCQGPTGPCSLRAAISRSNERLGPDAIEFGVAGTIEVENSPLPSVEDPVTIDATTLPGYAGKPLVALDGSQLPIDGSRSGLEIEAGPVIVEGLAIGNFADVGIEVLSEEPTRICASYIGTDMSGMNAAPNEFGIETFLSEGAQIGAGCPAGRGNLISGNEYYGIVDKGTNTSVAGNRIGLDAAGGPLANGALTDIPGTGAGIQVEPTSKGLLVGPEPGEAGNTIAFNVSSGVFIRENATSPTIEGNSIHSNTGLGIAIEADRPPVPVLSSALSGAAGTVVNGTTTGTAGETYFLDFYANESCDPSGAGEGQTPIGTAVVDAATTGNVSFSATGVAQLPAGQDVVTATVTPEGPGPTSEFSICRTAVRVQPPGPGPAPPTTHGLAPENGDSLVAVPSAGKILVKAPGEKKFHVLKEGEEIPVGSVVDATDGKVTITSVDARGKTQSATFFGGVFRVTQRDGQGLVVLRLVGGDFSSCGSSSSAASASKKAGNHLWGSGKGDFRSEGRHGSATVRGTIWLTEDRCDGTFFRVRRGVVTIRDFAAHRTVKLPAGETYLAD